MLGKAIGAGLRGFGGAVGQSVNTLADLEFALAKRLLSPGGRLARMSGRALMSAGKATGKGALKAVNYVADRPPLLFLTAGTLPVAGALMNRTNARMDNIKNTLVASSYRPDFGDMTVTAELKPFLEKQALFSPGNALRSVGNVMQNSILPMMVTGNQPHSNLAGSFASTLGAELAKKSLGLVSDMVSKSMHAPAIMAASRERKNILETLKQEDDVIAQADSQKLMEAYHTMTRFAPTLSTDKNAVKTFLRESALYGSGPNFMTIKQLADAERAVQEVQGVRK